MDGQKDRPHIGRSFFMPKNQKIFFHKKIIFCVVNRDFVTLLSVQGKQANASKRTQANASKASERKTGRMEK